MPAAPQPPCVRATSPYLRKLGASFVALSQWLDGVSDVILDPLWRSARRVSNITYAYWGLPALAFSSGWQRLPNIDPSVLAHPQKA